MTIAVTEQELKEITKAPRVTFDQITELMKRVTYVVVQRPDNTTSTFVHAYLDGKFLLGTGFSACVSEENFNPEIGERVAKEKAKQEAQNKLWELEGYSLYKSMKEQPKVIETTTFLDRLVTESTELKGRISELQSFLDKGQQVGVSNFDWELVVQQIHIMKSYSNVLDDRISNLK